VYEAGAVEWSVFAVAVALMLLVDLAGARRGQTPTVRSAAVSSGVWILISMLFGGFVALRLGREAGLTYLSAYTMEKSLSIDNLFVFMAIFAQTGIAPALQRRALYWGIVSALSMRAVMIAAGVALLDRFHWLIYPFAALLLFAAARMLWGEQKESARIDAGRWLCSSWIARFVPVTPVQQGHRFLVRIRGRLTATPLLVALVAIEATDLLFALDSIPAVLAITRDPFLAYTSNIFALLGLRSLYFMLAGVMQRLRFLRAGLALMLALAAVRMFIGDTVEVTAGTSLAALALILAVSIVASRLFPGRQTKGAAA
jgi:tellurite resistance protein TerC